MNAAHYRRRTARVRLVAATTAVATTMLLTSGAAAARARPAKFDPTGVIHVAGGAGFRVDGSMDSRAAAEGASARTVARATMRPAACLRISIWASLTCYSGISLYGTSRMA